MTKNILTPILLALIFFMVFNTGEKAYGLADTLDRQAINVISGDVNLPASQKQSIKIISSKLEVRIGKNKSGTVKDLRLPQGFNVNQAVSSIHRVVNGVVCCRKTDIRCIDNLCFNPSKDIFWTISINGDTLHSSATSILKDGDNLVLTYSGPVAHDRM